MARMKHSLRLTRITLAAISLAACCLLNCWFRPPAPTISGPDSGWTRAPLHFTARAHDGGPVRDYESWSWGDGTPDEASWGGGGAAHTYNNQGSYTVTCKAMPNTMGSATWWLDFRVASDPSDPCTVRVIRDTLVFPDTVVGKIVAARHPHAGACLLPSGSLLYVAIPAVETVAVVDTRTDSVVAAVRTPGAPQWCAASISGEYVYVSCASARRLAVVRTSDNVLVDSIGISGEPGRLALLPNDSFLYVAHADTNLVTVVRRFDAAVVAEVRVNGVPSALAARPQGDLVYVVSEAGNCVSVIRTSDNSVVSSFPFTGPSDVLFSPNGDTAYLACPVENSISIYGVPGNLLLATVDLDWATVFPRHLAVNPSGSCLYAFGNYGGHVVILRRSDNYLLRLTGVGEALVAVPSPDGSHVYVPTAAGVVVLGLRPGR